MLLNVDVQAGNQVASEYAHAVLWGWLDARPREQWPAMLRGDIAWGTEKTMCECEARGLPFLFKLRQTEGVMKDLVELSRRRAWRFAGGGWRAASSELQLQGWTKKRRVVVLRRHLPEQNVGMVSETPNGQKGLAGMAVVPKSRRLFEYAVLVTSLPEEDLLTVVQGRRGHLRRVEEPVGVDGLYHTRFEAEPVDGADRSADLQLVEFVGAAGDTGPPYRSGDGPSGAGLRSCQTDHAWKPIQSDDHELPWQGGSDRELPDNVNRSVLRFAAAAAQLNWKQRWARLARIILHEFLPKRHQAPAPLLS